MKITLIQTGKTHFKFIEEGFNEYVKRLKHYCKFEIKLLEIPSRLKNSVPDKIKNIEAELILKNISSNDFIILLDEKGKEFSSIQFAKFLEKQSLHQASLTFVIGGAYGFSDEIYKRANDKISLSAMTFSHQIIRLIFAEQLYRAFTIIKSEPYHHE